MGNSDMLMILAIVVCFCLFIFAVVTGVLLYNKSKSSSSSSSSSPTSSSSSSPTSSSSSSSIQIDRQADDGTQKSKEIVQLKNGDATLIMQSDGNLVSRLKDTVVWQSGTKTAGAKAYLGTNEISIKNGTTYLWISTRGESYGYEANKRTLVLRSDGHLDLYNGDSTTSPKMWSTIDLPPRDYHFNRGTYSHHFRIKLSTANRYATITDATPVDASKVYGKDNIEASEEKANWILIPVEAANNIYNIKWVGGTTPLYLNRWGNSISNDTVHLHIYPNDISSKWLIEFVGTNPNVVKLKRPSGTGYTDTKYLSMGADGSQLMMTATGTEFVLMW